MRRPLATEAAMAGRRRGEENGNASAPRPVSALEGHALWARTYDCDPNPLLALEERELQPLLPNLEGKDAIDVACGTGRWLEKLLVWGARGAAGVDFSPEMLAQALAKPPLRGHLVRGDVLALPFCDGASDLTVCSFAVGYVRDLGSFARELVRIARPQANLFVTDFHPKAHERGWRRAFRHAEGTVEMASFGHSGDQLCRTFEFEGFELKRYHESRLGEPERPIFEQAGKGHLFDDACKVLAIYICHFQLPSPPRLRKDG